MEKDATTTLPKSSDKLFSLLSFKKINIKIRLFNLKSNCVNLKINYKIILNTYKVLSKSRKCYVVLKYNIDDPAVWIIYVYKKHLFFKCRKGSHWFNDEKQALEYAKDVVENREL